MGMFFLFLINSGLEIYCIAERHFMLSPTLHKFMSGRLQKKEIQKWYKPDFMTFHSIGHKY